MKDVLLKLEENIDEFVSNAHSSQHRLFGFITTNIRSVSGVSTYVKELLPEYIKRKENYKSWQEWFTNPQVLHYNKQKFRRLEVAKILFRQVEKNQHLNEIGEKLYRIWELTPQYLDFILCLYLLTGRYFDVDNQPLVEINKVLSLYEGDFISDAEEALSGKNNRLLLAIIFYNPSLPEAYNLSLELLQNHISEEEQKWLWDNILDKDNVFYKRLYNAGGIGNYRKDVLVILNYVLFKNACLLNEGNSDYENIVCSYIEEIFQQKINVYFGITDKQALQNLLLNTKHRIILKDVFEFALGVKFDNNFVRKRERKNIKQVSFEKYKYRCFFDCFAQTDDERKVHALSYFHTKKDLVYLEGHHMVQMENSKFFKNDIDVVENIVPVCPNCHRKLHNAEAKVVKKMLKVYFENSDKMDLIRAGIFVDLETLERFYGIEGD